MVPRDDDREFAEVVLAYLDARRERYNDQLLKSSWPSTFAVSEDATGFTFYLSPSFTWKRRQPEAVAARIKAEAKRERKSAARRF